MPFSRASAPHHPPPYFTFFRALHLAHVPHLFSGRSRFQASCSRTPLSPLSVDPSAFYYQPHYLRGNPASPTRCNVLAMLRQAGRSSYTIFYCVFTAEHNYYQRSPFLSLTLSCFSTMSSCQVGKHVYLIARMNSRAHALFGLPCM